MTRTYVAFSCRRGSTFIITLWALVALVGVVLILSHEVRVEAIASGNRTARMQTDAAERGAEQWLLSVVETEVSSPGSTSTVQMDQRIIGDCGVWILSPDPENPSNYKYGLTDEGGKIDLNTASSDMLLALPGMTQPIVDSILYWRDPTATNPGQGADTDYYLNVGNHPDIPEGYKAKNAPFESIDELRLVSGITPDILFGSDTNHNGVVDPLEQSGGGAGANLSNANNPARGIYPFITVWGVQATTAAATTSTTGTAARIADVNAANQNALRSVLQNTIGGKTDNILLATRNLRPFANVFDWYFKVGLTSAEFAQVFEQITANPVAGPGGASAGAKRAKLNINAAAHEALLCLPGLDDGDVQQIIAQRDIQATGDPANISWLADALPRNKVVPIGGLVTGLSKVFSGDIVAVSQDGRAFRRVRVIIDGRAVPAKIVYRRELMDAGWPLPQDIRDSLRAGNGFVSLPPAGGPDRVAQAGSGASVKSNQRGITKS